MKYNLFMLLKGFLYRPFTRYTKALFDEWHIADASGIELGAACENYVNHERNVATTMDPIYLVVAMIPCAKLWPWLGQQIGADTVYVLCVQKWYNRDTCVYLFIHNIFFKCSIPYRFMCTLFIIKMLWLKYV